MSEIKVLTVRMNHHAFEIEIYGDRPPTVSELKQAVSLQYPNWIAVGMTQPHIDHTFREWHRYGRCWYSTGSKFIGGRRGK